MQLADLDVCELDKGLHEPYRVMGVPFELEAPDRDAWKEAFEIRPLEDDSADAERVQERDVFQQEPKVAKRDACVGGVHASLSRGDVEFSYRPSYRASRVLEHPDEL